jgi:hypothetical protein
MVIDTSAAAFTPAWAAVSDTLSYATRSEVEYSARTTVFTFPPGAEIEGLSFINYSDTMRPFWAIGAGHTLTYAVELVDSATGSILRTLATRQVVGRNWPGIRTYIDTGSVFDTSLAIFNSPRVYIRIRATQSGSFASGTFLEVISCDTSLASLFYGVSMGKKVVPVRRGAIPILGVLAPFPNPASNAESSIRFPVYEEGFVTVSISDCIGRFRETVVAERKKPGMYWARFDTERLQPGVYLIEERSNGMLAGRGMVVVTK